jgi:hypothetical protein
MMNGFKRLMSAVCSTGAGFAVFLFSGQETLGWKTGHKKVMIKSSFIVLVFWLALFFQH